MHRNESVRNESVRTSTREDRAILPIERTATISVCENDFFRSGYDDPVWAKCILQFLGIDFQYDVVTVMVCDHEQYHTISKSSRHLDRSAGEYVLAYDCHLVASFRRTGSPLPMR